MNIRVVDEYNEKGHLIYCVDYPGAFVRGATQAEGLSKLPAELAQYLAWLGRAEPLEKATVSVVYEKASALQIHDADTDVLFPSETAPLLWVEYEQLKGLALKSAGDFLALYRSIPNKAGTTLLPRDTFYGPMPRSAEEMYVHTRDVNSYYFGEIGVAADNAGDILSRREQGFALLETGPDFLENRVFDGSYSEQWSLHKVCRRFVWHDRIHVKAMYKMACSLCGPGAIENPFCFPG